MSKFTDIELEYLKTQRLRTLCFRKLQESLGVEMADFFFVSRTDGCTVEEYSPLLVGTKGVIDGKDDAISPHDL